MEWHDEARKVQAEYLRWLADYYESGKLTEGMQRGVSPERKFGQFTNWQVVRAIVGIVDIAEDVADEVGGPDFFGAVDEEK
jgi:hypothetical protein